MAAHAGIVAQRARPPAARNQPLCKGRGEVVLRGWGLSRLIERRSMPPQIWIIPNLTSLTSCNAMPTQLTSYHWTPLLFISFR